MRILPVLAGRTDLYGINEIKRLTRTPPARGISIAIPDQGYFYSCVATKK